MNRAGRAWIGVAVLLCAWALIGWGLPRAAIDWQPMLAWREPWRAWSAVGVHYGGAHLLGNLGGLLLAAALGWVARAPTSLAWAWFAAWPLTQFGLLLKPALEHYGGLSGVLHAGVAAVATFLLLGGTRAQRIVGGVVLAGLLVKALSEAPWGEPLRHSASLGILVAPFAHATGVMAGVVCAAVAWAWVGQRADVG